MGISLIYVPMSCSQPATTPAQPTITGRLSNLQGMGLIAQRLPASMESNRAAQAAGDALLRSRGDRP